MDERSSLYSSVASENAVGWPAASDATVLFGQYKGPRLTNSGDGVGQFGLQASSQRDASACADAPLRRLVLCCSFPSVSAVSALGGCGMSSLTSGIGGGMFGGSSQNTEVSSVSEDQLLAAAKTSDPNATGSTSVGEVAAGCPRLIVAPHDNYITFYEEGHVGDGMSVTQRGEITKTARECQVEPGRVVGEIRLLGPGAARTERQAREYFAAGHSSPSTTPSAPRSPQITSRSTSMSDRINRSPTSRPFVR